jgi:hypothetical protein
MVLAQSSFHVPVIPGQGLFLLLSTLVKPMGELILRLTSFLNQHAKLANISKEIGSSQESAKGAKSFCME